MTKLNRVTAKIFGETASTTNTPKEIGQFGSAKTGAYNATGDVATIQSLSAWSNGWIDAVTPTDQFPPLPEMTGVHKVLSYQNAYLLQQGIAEWDSATTYYTNGFCSKNGNIYISLSDNNLNNDPASDTVNWKIYGVIDDYANQDLQNLTTLGNARLQYAPFSINTGTVDNGKNATLRIPGGSSIVVEVPWTQPVLTENGTMGGATYACAASSELNTSDRAFQAFDGNADTNSAGWVSATSAPPHWITFYSPTPILPSKVKIIGSSDVNTLKHVIIQGSNNNSTWTNLGDTTNTSTASPITLNISCTTSTHYNYIRIYIESINVVTYQYARIVEVEITATYQSTISGSNTLICDPCTITTCDGRTGIDNSSATLDVSEIANGSYLVLKNCQNGSLSLASNLAISKTAPSTPSDGDYWLDYSTVPANLKYYDTSDWTINNNFVYIGNCTISAGSVSEPTNNLFNDNGYSQGTSTGSGWAMPSNVYDELTLGAHGSTYTAPANGWFTLCKAAGSTSSVYIELVNTSNQLRSKEIFTTTAGVASSVYIPAKKGETVMALYTATGTTAYFRFIYAVGSESEAQ